MEYRGRYGLDIESPHEILFPQIKISCRRNKIPPANPIHWNQLDAAALEITAITSQ